MAGQHGPDGTDRAVAVRDAGIRDVARMTRVSVASASFALNGQPGVGDDARRRIVAAARELGYRANPQAQALRRRRTTTYGLVIRNFSNPFFLEVLSGAEEIAGEAGATLIALDSRPSLERERRHLPEMAVQRLAGLAIAPVGTGGVNPAVAQPAPGGAGGGGHKPSARFAVGAGGPKTHRAAKMHRTEAGAGRSGKQSRAYDRGDAA